MSKLVAVSKIDFPYKVNQEDVKQGARVLFASTFPQVERMLSAFDNSEIITRNFCKPLEYYTSHHGFQEQNDEYINLSLEYSIQAIEQCLAFSKINKEDITDIIFVSTTGLSTPSLDALIINKMRLNQYINRTPVFGLGCAGGVAGYSKASQIASTNPNAIVLLVAVELCSLTFLKNEFSKSNFIGTTLFSDGVASVIITGDNHTTQTSHNIKFLGAQSKLYYDTLEVMGWEFQDKGFKVLFSQDIPTIIANNIQKDVTHFLSKYNLTLSDIKNYIFHPGGKKVISAYEEALSGTKDFLMNTRKVMAENGNMSSPSVIYVLEKFFSQGFNEGYGLMMSLGPGFSSEMALLQMSKA